MTIKDVINYFVNGYRFHKLTNMSSEAYRQWLKKGYVPIKSQIKLETLTQGKLKANLKHIGPVIE